MARIQMGLALVLLAMAAPITAPGADTVSPAPAEPMLFVGRSRIEVDAQGKVVAAQPAAGVPEAVGAAMLEHLYKVRFSPPMKDGHAVGGVTFARQEACAIPDGNKFRLAVRYLGNGPGGLQPKAAPVLLRVPVETKPGAAPVVLKVAYQVLADGSLSVDGVEIVSGRGRYSHDYLSSVRTWLEAQRAEPERVDGLPVPTKITFNMVFGPGQTFYGPFARQQMEQYIKAQTAAEKKARIGASGACALATRSSEPQSQHVALNSPFRALPEDEALQ